MEKTENNDFVTLINKAEEFIKKSNRDEALKMLNRLLIDEKNTENRALVYFDIARCYELNEDYITALVKIEKAIELKPNYPAWHWKKACFLLSMDYVLDFFQESFIALKFWHLSAGHIFNAKHEAVDFSKDIESVTLQVLKVANVYFRSLYLNTIKTNEFSKYINCLQNLSEIEIAPVNIREKYKSYKQDCIYELKRQINEVGLKAPEIPGDEFYENILNLCKQFLEIEKISISEKISVIKQYAEAKSILRFWYGYKIMDDFSMVNASCKTGDILLENGKIIPYKDCKETDLTIGVIFRNNNKVYVIDSYEHDAHSLKEVVEENGWHLANSDELALILKNKKDVNASFEKITGSKIFEGEYKDKFGNVVKFSDLKERTYRTKNRFIIEIDLAI
ncbi:MAG: tetratricopeptide repeat protein [Treponema sp.]|nr:tetratricopeptide repeat protein [Treponema sp.]MEE3435616.1 tetratricopeptide repeat protein [Treponema sp.]